MGAKKDKPAPDKAAEKKLTNKTCPECGEIQIEGGPRTRNCPNHGEREVAFIIKGKTNGGSGNSKGKGGSIDFAAVIALRKAFTSEELEQFGEILKKVKEHGGADTVLKTIELMEEYDEASK